MITNNCEYSPHTTPNCACRSLQVEELVHCCCPGQEDTFAIWGRKCGHSGSSPYPTIQLQPSRSCKCTTIALQPRFWFFNRYPLQVAADRMCLPPKQQVVGSIYFQVQPRHTLNMGVPFSGNAVVAQAYSLMFVSCIVVTTGDTSCLRLQLHQI